MVNRRWTVGGGVLGLAVLFAVALSYYFHVTGTGGAIRYGISPYQDTAIPVIAQSEGIFKKQDLNVLLVTVPWENIVPTLAARGKSIDVAIGSINTFLPREPSVNDGQADPVVFYAPLYVFKGASFIGRAGSGLKSYKELLEAAHGDAAAAAKSFVAQLNGKRIGYPPGTPYEQMFLELLRRAGVPKSDFDVRDVQLAEGLPAILAGDLDAAAAGVTQRTEAIRRGNYVLIEIEDLGFAEIIGLITTKSYATANPEKLAAIRASWFDSIQALRKNPEQASQGIIRYLAQNASTVYTYKEYMAALGAQEFPETQQDADKLFSKGGRFYWRTTWDIVNQYLVATGKISKPVPYDYYLQN